MAGGLLCLWQVQEGGRRSVVLVAGAGRWPEVCMLTASAGRWPVVCCVCGRFRKVAGCGRCRKVAGGLICLQRVQEGGWWSVVLAACAGRWQVAASAGRWQVAASAGRWPVV